MMDPLELIYLIGHKLNVRRMLRERRFLPVPVISIGNITAGGTGKTPATIAVAKAALARGMRPCILTRGYKGRMPGPVIVSPEMYVEDVGDEPLMMCEALGDAVPIVKGSDRHASGAFALEMLDPRPDLFILDDGFQHMRLAREVDLLLIGGREPLGGARLLPRGRLREPLSGIGRADIILLTKGAHGKSEIMHEIARHNPGAPLFEASHEPSHVRICSQARKIGCSPHTREQLSWLAGRPLFAFCGIAEPDSFFKAIEDAGGIIRGRRSFSDHYAFGPGDVDEIMRGASECGAQWIITTEKDIMRLKANKKIMEAGNCAALGIEFKAQEGFYDALFDLLERKSGSK